MVSYICRGVDDPNCGEEEGEKIQERAAKWSGW